MLFMMDERSYWWGILVGDPFLYLPFIGYLLVYHRIGYNSLNPLVKHIRDHNLIGINFLKNGKFKAYISYF